MRVMSGVDALNRGIPKRRISLTHAHLENHPDFCAAMLLSDDKFKTGVSCGIGLAFAQSDGFLKWTACSLEKQLNKGTCSGEACLAIVQSGSQAPESRIDRSVQLEDLPSKSLLLGKPVASIAL